MRRIRLRDGRSLAIFEKGTGTPALLVHGFTGSHAAWRPEVIDGLAEGVRLLAVDLIGHGASDRPHDPARYALSAVVDDLCDVLDALDVPRAIWIGYSMLLPKRRGAITATLLPLRSRCRIVLALSCGPMGCRST